MPNIYYLSRTRVNTHLLDVGLGGMYQHKDQTELAHLKPFENNSRDRKIDAQNSPLRKFPKYHWPKAGIFQVSLKPLLLVLLLQLSPAAVTSVWDHSKLGCFNTSVSVKSCWILAHRLLLSALILLITIQADLSASQQLSCGLPGRGTPQAADSHTLLPTACGERWRVAKLSHILSKPLISGLIFAKICDTNRSLLTWQLVLSNSVPLFPLSILLPYINAVWQNQWSG